MDCFLPAFHFATPSLPHSPIPPFFMPARAALLDIDGTLVDSNDAHARAWVETLAEAGHDVPFERVRPLIGKGGDKLLPELLGDELAEREGEKLSARRTDLFLERHVQTVRVFPEVRALLERMRADGFRLVVATSANERELEALMKIAGVGDLLYEQTTKDDADRSKPDPDIIHAALARAGTRASETLMLGDTPYDIEAAWKAGVGAVALRCGGWWDDQALAGALGIYDDPAALLAAFDDSPYAHLARAAAA